MLQLPCRPYQQLLIPALPESFPLPIVIVQHRSERLERPHG